MEIAGSPGEKNRSKAMLFIMNGTILTMTGKIYYRGDVFIRNGKIEAVGENLTYPKDAEVVTRLYREDLDNPDEDKLYLIDAKENIVMPGLIEAHCHMGITEEKKEWRGMTAMKRSIP